MSSTAWAGPQGPAWDRLYDLLETTDWEAWHADYLAYWDWALHNLAELTSYANQLGPEQLAALDTEYRKTVSGGLRGRHAWTMACSITVTVRQQDRWPGLRDDLNHLRALGPAVYGAAHALIGQGLVSDRKHINLLAGPWLACGHDLPRTDKRA